jgi:hypothetical protein
MKKSPILKLLLGLFISLSLFVIWSCSEDRSNISGPALEQEDQEFGNLSVYISFPNAPHSASSKRLSNHGVIPSYVLNILDSIELVVSTKQVLIPIVDAEIGDTIGMDTVIAATRKSKQKVDGTLTSIIVDSVPVAMASVSFYGLNASGDTLYSGSDSVQIVVSTSSAPDTLRVTAKAAPSLSSIVDSAFLSFADNHKVSSSNTNNITDTTILFSINGILNNASDVLLTGGPDTLYFIKIISVNVTVDSLFLVITDSTFNSIKTSTLDVSTLNWRGTIGDSVYEQSIQYLVDSLGLSDTTNYFASFTTHFISVPDTSTFGTIDTTDTSTTDTVTITDDSLEENDSIEIATDYAANKTGDSIQAILVGDDKDFFSFTADAGDTIDFWGYTESFEMITIEIYSPNDSMLYTANPADGDFEDSLITTDSGSFSFAIFSDTLSDTLSIDYTFGIDVTAVDTDTSGNNLEVWVVQYESDGVFKALSNDTLYAFYGTGDLQFQYVADKGLKAYTLLKEGSSVGGSMSKTDSTLTTASSQSFSPGGTISEWVITIQDSSDATVSDTFWVNYQNTPTLITPDTSAISNSSISLFWTGVDYIDYYKILRTITLNSSSFDSVGVTAGSESTYEDTGLSSGQKYYYLISPCGKVTKCAGTGDYTSYYTSFTTE